MQDRPLCHPRKRFTSRVSADAAARAIYTRDKKSLHAIRCKHCGGYHLE